MSRDPGPPPAGPRPCDEFLREVERHHHACAPVAAPACRIYCVKPSRPEDHFLLRDGVADPQGLVTIFRIDGERLIVPDCFGWADTDVWAGWRWREADRVWREMRREP